MRLQEFMQTDIKTINANASAVEAWSVMDRHNIRHLVALDGNEVVGILSDKDLGGSLGQDTVQGRRVADVMTPSMVSAKPTTTVKEAANLMRGHRINCLPVFEGKALVGLVTSSDLLALIGKGLEQPRTLGPDWDSDQGRKVLNDPPAYKKRGTNFRHH